MHLIPLIELPTAFHTPELLFEQVFCYFRIPEDIVSEQGPQSTSRAWAGFMEKLGVSDSLTYHPHATGQIEGVNQKVGRFLCACCSTKQEDRPKFPLRA